MGNVCEGAAVHDGGGAFQRLHQIGVDGIFQQGSHCAVRFQIPGKYGLTVISISHQNVAQTLFQVFPVFCQTENSHNLRSNCNIKSIFTRNPVYFTTESTNSMT